MIALLMIAHVKSVVLFLGFDLDAEIARAWRHVGEWNWTKTFAVELEIVHLDVL